MNEHSTPELVEIPTRSEPSEALIRQHYLLADFQLPSASEAARKLGRLSLLALRALLEIPVSPPFLLFVMGALAGFLVWSDPTARQMLGLSDFLAPVGARPLGVALALFSLAYGGFLIACSRSRLEAAFRAILFGALWLSSLALGFLWNPLPSTDLSARHEAALRSFEASRSAQLHQIAERRARLIDQALELDETLLQEGLESIERDRARLSAQAALQLAGIDAAIALESSERSRAVTAIGVERAISLSLLLAFALPLMALSNARWMPRGSDALRLARRALRFEPRPSRLIAPAPGSDALSEIPIAWPELAEIEPSETAPAPGSEPA